MPKTSSPRPLISLRRSRLNIFDLGWTWGSFWHFQLWY